MPAPFHHDLTLRATGLLLLAGAAWAMATLFAHPPTTAAVAPATLAEASAGFLGGSLGTTLLLLGRHIHDRVAVARRWSSAA